MVDGKTIVVAALTLLPRVGPCCVPQDSLPTKPDRAYWVAGSSALIIAGTMYGLNTAWYEGEPRTNFHFFDDRDEWQQMDKVGHSFATYSSGKWAYQLYKAAGASERTAFWLGGTLGLTYLTGIELLDSQFERWGFSWWDMGANALGTTLFMAQHAGWGEQRLLIKYSAHLTSYAEQRPEVLGKGLAQRLLKDYNGQTYWLSFSPFTFTHMSKAPSPRWLCLSFGYGADGMLTARRGQQVEGVHHCVPRHRQYYLSVDIDLERIPVRSKFLRVAFSVLNVIKLPAPALEFGNGGRMEFHPFYF